MRPPSSTHPSVQRLLLDSSRVVGHQTNVDADELPVTPAAVRATSQRSSFPVVESRLVGVCVANETEMSLRDLHVIDPPSFASPGGGQAVPAGVALDGGRGRVAVGHSNGVVVVYATCPLPEDASASQSRIQLMHRLELPRFAVSQVAWSSDGGRLAVLQTHATAVVIFNPATNGVDFVPVDGLVVLMEWAPHASVLCIGATRSLAILYDVDNADRRTVLGIQSRKKSDKRSPVRGIAWSAEAPHHVAVRTSSTIFVFSDAGDAIDAAPVEVDIDAVMLHSTASWHMRFAFCTLATGLKLYRSDVDVATHVALRFPAYNGSLSDFAIGNQYAVCGFAKGAMKVVSLEPASIGTEVFSLQLVGGGDDGASQAVALAMRQGGRIGGRFVCAVAGRTVCVVDLLKMPPSSGRAHSPKEPFDAVGPNDPATAVVYRWEMDPVRFGAVASCAWSTDGTTLAVTSQYAVTRIFDFDEDVAMQSGAAPPSPQSAVKRLPVPVSDGCTLAPIHRRIRGTGRGKLGSVAEAAAAKDALVEATKQLAALRDHAADVHAQEYSGCCASFDFGGRSKDAYRRQVQPYADEMELASSVLRDVEGAA